jgi:hypothetical protein
MFMINQLMAIYYKENMHPEMMLSIIYLNLAKTKSDSNDRD